MAVKIFKTSLQEFRDRREYMSGDARYAKMKVGGNPRKVRRL